MTYSKRDVQFHSDYPAVNVKVRGYVTDDIMRQVYADIYGDDQGAACSLAWFESVTGDETWTWEIASRIGFDDAQEFANEMWPNRDVKIWSEGRSGGWLVVEGLADIDTWDAIELSKWRRFETICRELADDQFYRMADLAIRNIWETATGVADASKDLVSE